MNACVRVAFGTCRRFHKDLTVSCTHAQTVLDSSLHITEDLIRHGNRYWSSQPEAPATHSTVAQSPLDGFTASLQKKTEEQLFELIQKARAAKNGDESIEAEETEEVCSSHAFLTP